jgi:hypothetical protein
MTLGSFLFDMTAVISGVILRVSNMKTADMDSDSEPDSSDSDLDSDRKSAADSDSKSKGCFVRIMGERWAATVKFLYTLSKSGSLAISAAWTFRDLFLLVDSTPGSGTLALGSIAVAATLLLLLFEFGSWLLGLLDTVVRLMGVLEGRAAKARRAATKARRDARARTMHSDSDNEETTADLVYIQGQN